MCMLHQQYDLWNPKPWPWHSEAVTADAQPVEVILKMQLFPSCGEAKSKKCDTERKVMLLFFFTGISRVGWSLPTSSNIFQLAPYSDRIHGDIFCSWFHYRTRRSLTETEAHSGSQPNLQCWEVCEMYELVAFWVYPSFTHINHETRDWRTS